MYDKDEAAVEPDQDVEGKSLSLSNRAGMDRSGQPFHDFIRDTTESETLEESANFHLVEALWVELDGEIGVLAVRVQDYGPEEQVRELALILVVEVIAEREHDDHALNDPGLTGVVPILILDQIVIIKHACVGEPNGFIQPGTDRRYGNARELHPGI